MRAIDDFSDLDPNDLDAEEAMGARFWRMANGQYIHLTKMTDEHLRNTHRHMRNREQMWSSEEHAALSYTPASPDSMAAYYADRAADDAWLNQMHCRAWVEIFKAEIDKRGIKPHPGY